MDVFRFPNTVRKKFQEKFETIRLMIYRILYRRNVSLDWLKSTTTKVMLDVQEHVELK